MSHSGFACAHNVQRIGAIHDRSLGRLLLTVFFNFQESDTQLPFYTA